MLNGANFESIGQMTSEGAQAYLDDMLANNRYFEDLAD
jgi:hypothetical protein